jgi:hypothetical protein
VKHKTKKAKLKRTYSPRCCKTCGVEFTPTGGYSPYCKPCAKKSTTKNRAIWQHNNLLKCGVLEILTFRNTRYCKACKGLAYAEKEKARNKATREKRKAKPKLPPVPVSEKTKKRISKSLKKNWKTRSRILPPQHRAKIADALRANWAAKRADL